MSTVVRNLSREVFPDIFKDFLLSKDSKIPSKWTTVTELPAMWEIVDAEFVAWRTMNLEKFRAKAKEPKEPAMKEEYAGFAAAIVDQVVEKLNGKHGFAAVVGEKRELEEGSGQDKYRRPKPDRACFNFAETGTCVFGSRCRFIHETDRKKLEDLGYEPPPPRRQRPREYERRTEYQKDDRYDRYERDRKREKERERDRYERDRQRERERDNDGDTKKKEINKALKAFVAAYAAESNNSDNSDSSDSEDDKKTAGKATKKAARKTKARKQVTLPAEINLANGNKASLRGTAMEEFLKSN